MLKPAPDALLPNVLVHAARMVNTPMGICKAGMMLINPENKEMPDFFGFVAEDLELGQYYGPKIFKGTPFEGAPVFKAVFTFEIDYPNRAYTKVVVENNIIEKVMDISEPSLLFSFTLIQFLRKTPYIIIQILLKTPLTL